MRFQTRQSVIFLLTFFLLATFFPLHMAGGVSTSSTSAVLYVGQLEAVSDYGNVKLAMPPALFEGEVFIPAGALRNLFKWDVVMISRSELYSIKSPDRTIVIDVVKGMHIVEGIEFESGKLARIEKGQLFVRAKSIGTLMNLTVSYEEEAQRINLTYVPPTPIEELLPVARFYTSKSEYKIGERIEYFDVSYSPTEENLASVEWSGKRDVFFTAGNKPVKIQVTDKAGRKSRWYTKMIRVVPEVQYDRFQYHVFSEDIGKSMPYTSSELRRSIINLPKLAGLTPSSYQRKLMVSNSPETFYEPGILYSDTLEGRVRIYASHVNGMSERMLFVLMATNPSNQETKLTVTRRGEIIPSIYAQLNGRQGILEYMIDRQAPKQQIVPSKGTVMLAKLPVLNPSQGVNVVYDVETEPGIKMKYSVIAVSETQLLTRLMESNLEPLKQLSNDIHIRGTFDTAEKGLEIEGTEISEPKALSIADGVNDPILTGTDMATAKLAKNPGSYGVIYRLTIKNPPAMSVMLRARGGSYKGHFEINNRIVLAPASGTFRPQHGLLLLARTTNGENQLKIEFSPPAGSSLPIDLVFLPHANSKSLY